MEKKKLKYDDEEISEMLNNPITSDSEYLIKRAEENGIFSDEDERMGLITNEEKKRAMRYFLIFTACVFITLVVLYHFGYGISLYGMFRGGK
jgi:hypothetical protein